jgi:hypothetical protein
MSAPLDFSPSEVSSLEAGTAALREFMLVLFPTSEHQNALHIVALQALLTSLVSTA